MRHTLLVTVLTGLAVVSCGQEPAGISGAAGAVPCDQLASLAVDHTTIASAAIVEAGRFEQPPSNFPELPADYSMLPEFCRVTGSIAPTPDSDIRFELWLPATNWNGKFLQTGNGGAAGSIFYFVMGEPLTRGYAVANTDTGHRGGGGDFSWAVGEAEKLIDFQHRAVHELTITGKAITEAHYGRTPEKSYFQGCSTGGRQGLKEAQRYPGDYDAIIAGAPANNWVPLLSLSVVIENNLGSGGLRADKLGVLKEAAIAACDARDGVVDRVITNPGDCDFDPASLRCGEGERDGCLSGTEVSAAKRIYAGVVDGDGNVLIPGTGPASEPEWGAYLSPGFRIGSSWYRHVVMNDPDWDPATFDVDTDFARAGQLDAGETTAMDPDLSRFIARGGKLILYHGTTDGVIPYGNTVNYYESVVEALGENAISDSVRFYLVPGMSHCAGGEGAWMVEWIAALEAWAEDGETPGALQAMHPPFSFGQPDAPPGETFTRPVCPYPQLARYQGQGDTADATSFECAGP